MTDDIEKTKPDHRTYPTVNEQEDGSFQVSCASKFEMQELLGMKTTDASLGVYKTVLNALGKQANEYSNLVSAMFAEMEPRDGVEAMLIGQMTATHVAMTTLSSKVSYQSSAQVLESCERSMTRLSRTYLAQMEALKKYRAKAQQTVRVERVNVERGGQAIVGDVTTRGRVEDER